MRTLRRTTKPTIINRSKIRRMLPIFCEKVWTMQPMLLMNLIRTLTAQVLSKHYLEEALELVVSRLSDLPVVAWRDNPPNSHKLQLSIVVFNMKKEEEISFQPMVPEAAGSEVHLKKTRPVLPRSLLDQTKRKRPLSIEISRKWIQQPTPMWEKKPKTVVAPFRPCFQASSPYRWRSQWTPLLRHNQDKVQSIIIVDSQLLVPMALRILKLL